MCSFLSTQEIFTFIHSFLVFLLIFKKSLTCPLFLGKKWQEKNRWVLKGTQPCVFLCVSTCCLFFFFPSSLFWRGGVGIIPHTRKCTLKLKWVCMSYWFNKSKSLMAKQQLPCHGKFPVVRTAGCWCYLKKINILFLNFSYVANNEGSILKTTTKVKSAQ